MENKSFWQIFKESFLEGVKGSGKAYMSYLAMLAIIFIIVWDTIYKIEYPALIIFQLMLFIGSMYGIKMNQAVQKMKLENSDDVPAEAPKPAGV